MTVPFEVIQEHHPRIAESILLLWGHEECRIFLNRLIMDSRDGQRQGFSPFVAGAILHLLHEHDRIFPKFEPEVDTWHDRR